MLDAFSAPGRGQVGPRRSSIRPFRTGEDELMFVKRRTAVSNVLIGVDDAHSRAMPIYHGITGAETPLSPLTAALPKLMATGDGRIRTYLWFLGFEDWTLPSDPHTAREKLLEVYEGWAWWMRMLIERYDDAAMYARPLYYLLLDHWWAHMPGMTILGDAARLMSPFVGEGANLAMVDGFDLEVVLANATDRGKGVEEREAAIARCKDTRIEEGRRVGAMAGRYLFATFSGGQSSV